ncbi:hypothetical protein Vafri_21763, partial [Volvox africanus]
MFSLPRKRRVDIEDDGTSDEEEWHVGYAEDIDEQRAELLRRLDSKASSPTKLVTPWVSPIGPSPDAIPHGALVLDVSVYHQHPDAEDGRGLSGADGCDGGFGSTSGDAGKSSCGGRYDEAVVSPPVGFVDMMGRQRQQQQQWTPELLRRDVQDQQLTSVVGAAAGGLMAATQVNQLLLLEGLGCGPGGGSDYGPGGGGSSALRCGGNGPTDRPSIRHGDVSVGVGGEGGNTSVTTVASPYAALLGTPRGGGVGRGGRGGGGLGSVATGRTLPSPLAPRLGPNLSSSSRGAQRPSRGGLGGLLSLPPTGSSQKGKKAKFAIRESPNPSPVTATGHPPQPRQPLPHHHRHCQHMPGDTSQGNMDFEGGAG